LDDSQVSNLIETDPSGPIIVQPRFDPFEYEANFLPKEAGNFSSKNMKTLS
jgi:hypothetical protein